jgi:large subunit ribosomal protein L32
MGALPKRKISHHRRGNRRSHQALRVRQMILCPQCGALTLPHAVCPSCGTYKGAQVLKIKEEKKSQ